MSRWPQKLLTMTILLVICVFAAIYVVADLSSQSLTAEDNRLNPLTTPSRTPKPPPGVTPTATPVDADYLPALFDMAATATAVVSPTPEPSPTLGPTKTPIPPPSRP